MAEILGFLQGKKTHLLVLVAIVLVLGGAIDPDQIAAGGLDFSEMSFERLLQAVLTGVISTVKAAYDRRV